MLVVLFVAIHKEQHQSWVPLKLRDSQYGAEMGRFHYYRQRLRPP